MEPIWQNARSLRNASTDAERRLWQWLRGKQLQGRKFRRRYPIAGYIAYFACVDARLVIELDGGQHPDQKAHDHERTRKIASNGYRVLRFWNDEVLPRVESVLEEIMRHLDGRARE